MASVIKIKRSGNASAPGSLSYGELANSFGAGTQANGGDRLYIGDSGGTPVVIGGKYFTDLLDHPKGTLTADSAIIVDSNSKIDTLKVDDIILDGNIISADSQTLTDRSLVFTPKADGVLTIVQQISATTAYESLISADDDIPNKKYVDDGLSAQSTLTVRDEADSDQSVDLGSDVLKIDGGEGIDTAVTINGTNDLITVTVSGENASASNKGIASFSGSYFTVTSGDVAIDDATTTTKGIASFAGADFDVTSGAVSLEDSVVKSVTTDSGAMTPTSHGFSVLGGEGIDVTHTGTTITVAGETATVAVNAGAANLGIASFDSANFESTSGFIGIKDGGVSNAELANSSVALGGQTLTLGAAATTALTGMTSIVIGDLTYSSNTINATGAGTNINIELTPKGTGTVDVGSARITSVDTPTQDSDAATKAYVDSVSQGLDIKESVRVATTAELTVTASNGPGTPPSVGKTLTGPTEVLVIDGVTLSLGDRVLVKDQDDGTPGLSVDNGIYTVTTLGVGGSVAWVLTRAEDADGETLNSDSEVTAGMFTFVSEGTDNANNGYVLSTNDTITLETTALTFTQFSGAGSVIAGDGLTKDGNTLDVVGTANRITVSADAVDIASTYVGQTSITTLGTITTGTWNGSTITVPNGGTGATTFTSKGIIYGNSQAALQVTAAGTYDAVNGVGQILSVDSNQTPVWTNTIDGGVY